MVMNESINIDGKVDDSLRSTCALVDKLVPLRKLQQGDVATVDMSKLRRLGVDGVTMIAGSILEARKRGLAVSVALPTEPPGLPPFFQDSGFNHLILNGAPPRAGDPKNLVMSLRRFDRSRYENIEPIVQRIAREKPVSGELRQYLQICIDECLQNTLGCARFMLSADEIHVSLMDWGEGIFNTLRRRYPDTRDEVMALERVLYGGFSARTQSNNLGRGIDNLRSVVTESFSGSLYIITGRGTVEIGDRRKPRYASDLMQEGFQGTVVCFALPLDPMS